MPDIARRPTRLIRSAIGEMVMRAHELGAINLASGDPDFDPPQEVIEAAQRALAEGHNQLSDSWGAMGFRQALAEKASRHMGVSIDAERHVTATAGSTEAILAATMTVCDPDDRVLIFSPYYEAHLSAPMLCGAEPVFLPLSPPDFSLKVDQLRKEMAAGAKALILSSPGNPSGKVFTREELQTIAGLAIEYDLFVITDDVYEHIVYPPHEKHYISSLPGMFERTLSCGSLSKTYHMTGWRLGYVIAPPKLSEHVRTVHDCISLSAPEPLIHGAITALRFPDAYYRGLQETYSLRLALMSEFLDQCGLSYVRPSGAFYMLLDISPFGFEHDEAFCHWMLEEVLVAAAPGSSFFSTPVQQYVRLTFAKREDTLIEAGERMLKLSSQI
jgi:aminotransferase